MYVCACEGHDQRRRERRMSTESCDEFTAHHRYDSDSSLDLATHTSYNSMVPPTKVFKRALSQHLRTGLDSTERDSAGTQNDGNVSVFTPDHSVSIEADLKSNDAQDGADEVRADVLVSFEGRRRSRPASEVVAGGQAVADAEGEFGNEGHSRSVIRRCVECGCETLSTVTTSVYTSNEVSAAELGQTQGSADTRQSRCGGNTGAQGEVGRTRGFSGVQGKVRSYESSDGGRSVSAAHDLERSGAVIDMKSYSGVVSRQLCQQLVQLLNELDTARHVNTQVSLID